MSGNYDDLSRRGIKGDLQALDELMTLGTKSNAEGQFENAVKAFKEAAIGFRMSDLRNRWRAEAAEEQAKWADEVRKIYQTWIEENPGGFRQWSNMVPGIDRERIRQVVIEQLLHEEGFAQIFPYLERVLSDLGMEFYSPGGSVQRRVCVLVCELFGLEPHSKWLDHSAVRIGLDLLASQVVARCSHN
jgi:hypothetical protein